MEKNDSLLKLAPAERIKNMIWEELRILERKDAEVILTNLLSNVRWKLADAIVIRRVHVDRNKRPQEILNDTRRIPLVDLYALRFMPKGDNAEVDVVFFKLDGTIEQADVKAEYEKRGLIPDAYAVAMVNAQDRTFADSHPNGTPFKLYDRDNDSDYDDNGYMCFYLSEGERYVRVCSDNDCWPNDMWIGGIRKVPSA